MAKIGILGSGGWGTAIAIMLATYGHNIVMWSFSKEEKEDLVKFRENKPYLPGVKIPENVSFTNDISKCADTDVVVMATPSHGVRNTAKLFSEFAKKDTIILNISKGIENGTYKTLSEVLREELPNCRIAVMSGPSHAEEVSRGIPTTNVVASEWEEVPEYIQDMFMNPSFRLYTNTDVRGVELGGSLKNVFALCCGILDGVGFGDNTKAALMTRGLLEMTKLGVKIGAKPSTFSGLSGMGDLIVTCTSMHSRNRRAGILIGQGMTVDEAQKEVKMVVEGIKSCKAAKELADKVGVEIPIINETYKVLFEGKSVREAVSNLMGRMKKNETENDFLNI